MLCSSEHVFTNLWKGAESTVLGTSKLTEGDFKASALNT